MSAGKHERTILMKTALFGFCAALLAAVAPRPATAANALSLDGAWHYLVDVQKIGLNDYRNRPMRDRDTFGADRHGGPRDLIEYNFELEPTLAVPGDWNSQDPHLWCYEGLVWYQRSFDWTRTPGLRSLLTFDGANHTAIVWVNGRRVGQLEGGFTPFSFDVTEAVKDGKNSLVVAVENERRADRIPTLIYDWWNYGGITRSVRLTERPAVRVEDWRVGLDGVSVQLNAAEANVEVGVRISELGLDLRGVTDGKGAWRADLGGKSPERWSPENPKLYAVEVVANGETLRDEVGFRTIATRGRELLLNGKPIFLKGVSIHDEAIGRMGRTRTPAEAEALLKEAKALGCNYVRLAHYPHPEYTVRAAEKLGILVWSEIPVYWTIDWRNERTYRNAEQQLAEMIRRDANRANVIIWSIANETPHSKERDAFLGRLARKAKELNSTRLVSMAMEVTGQRNFVNRLNDNLHEWVDVVSFNEYIGWYRDVGTADKMRWEIPYEKPVIVSEFGGGAVAGRHGDKWARFTEENQAMVYDANLRMFERIEGLAGISPWILKDFMSPRRPLRGTQDFFNRKGLVSDQGRRKAAFDVLKSWYEKR